MTRLSPLLPPRIGAERASVMVADSLQIPTHPSPIVPVELGQLNTPEELRTRSHVLAEQTVLDSSERFAFIDKAHPHAIHDLMIISSGAETVPNVYQHSPQFVYSALGSIGIFANVTRELGMTPVISWSYDPHTNDRASGQGEKRWHAHFVGRTKEEVGQVHAIARSLGELPAIRQRRIADEFATIGARVLYDSLRHIALPGIRLIPPGTTPQSQLGLQFGFDKGWAAFDRAGVHDVASSLAEVDKRYHELFNTYVATATTGSYGTWTRPILRNDATERTLDLSFKVGIKPETAALVAHFISKLDLSMLTPEATQRFKRAPDEDSTSFCYPLGGVSYTTCISEINGEPRGHIRPNMFTDLGGAGVALVDGITTKVKKTKRPMTKAEFASRQTFQSNVLAALL